MVGHAEARRSCKSETQEGFGIFFSILEKQENEDGLLCSLLHAPL